MEIIKLIILVEKLLSDSSMQYIESKSIYLLISPPNVFCNQSPLGQNFILMLKYKPKSLLLIFRNLDRNTTKVIANGNK